MSNLSSALEQSLREALAGNGELIRQDAGCWRVLVAGELVTVELDEETRRVCFSVQYLEDIGELPREKLIMMLQYSFLWNVTDGLHFALNDQERPLLMASFGVSDMSGALARTIVFGLLQKWSVWKEVFSSHTKEMRHD